MKLHYALVLAGLFVTGGCSGRTGGAEEIIDAQSTRITELESKIPNSIEPLTITDTLVGELSPLGGTGPSEPIAAAASTVATIASGTVSESLTPEQPDCGGDGWSLIPTSVQASETDSQGFKKVHITLALENNSNQWGKVRGGTGPGAFEDSLIATEGGFTYASQGGWLRTFEYVPPHFVVTGIDRDGERAQFYVAFDVAASQNHFVVTVPQLYVQCLTSSWGQPSGLSGPFTLDLDNDVRQPSYPTSLPANNFKTLADPIQVPGKGSLELLGIAHDGYSLIIRHLFSNASQGYETQGRFSAYTLIGDDGYMILSSFGFGGNFQAGPAQSSEVTLTFPVWPDISGYKLVAGIDEGFFEVYTLPGDVEAVTTTEEMPADDEEVEETVVEPDMGDTTVSVAAATTAPLDEQVEETTVSEALLTEPAERPVTTESAKWPFITIGGFGGLLVVVAGVTLLWRRRNRMVQPDAMVNRFCIHCGAAYPSFGRFCIKCGRERE